MKTTITMGKVFSVKMLGHGDAGDSEEIDAAAQVDPLVRHWVSLCSSGEADPLPAGDDLIEEVRQMSDPQRWQLWELSRGLARVAGLEGRLKDLPMCQRWKQVAEHYLHVDPGANGTTASDVLGVVLGLIDSPDKLALVEQDREYDPVVRRIFAILKGE